MILAVGLLLAAVVLAFAAPRYLHLTVAPHRSARLALAAWTGSLIALLATVGAAPAALLIRPGRGVLDSAHTCMQNLRATGTLPWLPALEVGLAVAMLLLLARLVAVATLLIRRHRRDTADHLRMLHLIAEDRRSGAGAELLILPTDDPLCYSLGGPAPTIVVGRGRATDPAALAHEYAHLAGRHHLLILLARICARALPWLPLCRQAPDAMAGLVEFAADRRAARLHGDRPVQEALDRWAAAAEPGDAVVLPAAPGSPAAVSLRRQWLAAAPTGSTRGGRADYPAAAMISLAPAALSVGASGTAVTALCALLAG